jgi:hypothetical protein
VLDLAWERPPLFTVAAVLAIATVAVIGTAAGQELDRSMKEDARPLRPPPKLSTVEDITGIKQTPPLYQTSTTPSGPMAPVRAKTVLTNEPGGLLDRHANYFALLRTLGSEVEIRGMCQSACTLVMGVVEREKICFSAKGYLNFHLASAVPNVPSVTVTKTVMTDRYPADIQAWIEAKGGLAKMPYATFWTLRADELWEMGYRKCPD